MNVSGRVAIVTGGGQGIGRAIAEKLASYGADIAVVDVNLEKATEVSEGIKRMGRRSMALKVDVVSAEETEAMAEKVFKEMEAIHILVNNAGITRDGLILRMKEEDWDAVIDVNLKGAFNCTKSALKYMTKARWGRIVNIASVVGVMGNAGQANYAASKAGLIGLTKSVAREFATRNITCNAVAPGFIETAMTDALSEQVKAELLTKIPLGRLGGAGDVATGVLFLASNASNYITGQVLNINGGMAM